MHATPTTDFDIVLNGTVGIELDDGEMPPPPWPGVRMSSRLAARGSHARDQLKGAGDDGGQEADGQQAFETELRKVGSSPCE
jgi:hypothetical protein